VKDLFWWVFENTWQPNADDQWKLFRRMTQNYVQLLSFVKHPYYEETFLKVMLPVFNYVYDIPRNCLLS